MIAHACHANARSKHLLAAQVESQLLLDLGARLRLDDDRRVEGEHGEPAIQLGHLDLADEVGTREPKATLERKVRQRADLREGVAILQRQLGGKGAGALASRPTLGDRRAERAFRINAEEVDRDGVADELERWLELLRRRRRRRLHARRWVRRLRRRLHRRRWVHRVLLELSVVVREQVVHCPERVWLAAATRGVSRGRERAGVGGPCRGCQGAQN